MSTAALAERVSAPDAIETTIRYVVHGESAVFYPAEREKSYWPADDRTVTVRNMRRADRPLTMDTCGFQLLRHRTAVKDFFDPEEVRRVFYPEVYELAKQLTGAQKVIAFGEVPRSDNPEYKQGRLPSFGAHVDYGRRTLEDFTREILGDEAEQWLQKRVILINFWRPITPVYRCPLALCDASSVRREDLHPSEIRGGLDNPERGSLWGYNLSYNPDHRWYYAPAMQVDEVLAFKLYDDDASQPQWTGHTAIEDPTTPDNAPPRESMEIRTISFVEGGPRTADW